MSQQADLTRLKEENVSRPTPSSPVQSSSGVCIKQEYFEDQLLMTRTIKIESESAPNEHNIIQSIKVEVKEEHYHDQDCVVKCDLDQDEGEQMDTKIKVEVEDVSSGQLVQHFKCVKKEEEDGGEYVMECDCEECEICRVKMELKEEFDESGETELGGNSGLAIEGGTRVKKEEEEDAEVKGERPNKIQRMDRVLGNVPVGSLSPSTNGIPINVEYIDDQVATSSTHQIEDHTQQSQPVTVPIPTPIVSQFSSSTQHVNETLRDELLNAKPMMENVTLVVDVAAVEFDRGQVAEDNSTLNPAQTDQDDDELSNSANDNHDGSVVASNEPSSSARARSNRVTSKQSTASTARKLNKRKQSQPNRTGKRSKKSVEVNDDGDGDDIAVEDREESKVEVLYLNCTQSNCTVKLDSLDHLHDHLSTVHQLSPLQCYATDCNARFDEPLQIRGHIKLSHSRNTRFLCSVCSKDFDSQPKAYIHWYFYHLTGEFQCNLANDCAQVTDIRSKMKTHQKTKHHSQSNHFNCTHPGCTASFAFKSDLNQHQLTHLTTNQFHCNWPHCRKQCKLRSNLIKHIRTQHFGLPQSMKAQKEKNIVDLRDPNEYVRVLVDE